ncbi:uncharacterized protein [Trachinotus anak]|uniref:uncharacterized protein isoform X2 n=1 Tax=Trachinotus anak TaxID=443729 RepID=UPI0039F1F0BC
MACGVHLGILLICLIQAEHVRCLWATQAKSSHRQNGNRYVGFSQLDSGLQRLGSSYPQDQFRQDSISPGSAPSTSLNSKTAVSRGYNNQRFSSGSNTQTVPQPTQSGYASVKLMQRMTNLKQVNAQKQSFGLSTAIASGTSVSKYNQKQNDPTDISKKRTWPVQQDTSRTSQYLPGSSASVQGPSRERGFFTSSSHQSAAQKPPSAAAKTPAYYGQRSFSPSVKSSTLFSAGALPPQQGSVKMQTSVSAPARRVYKNGQTKATKPSSFSSTQNERMGYNPSQALAGKMYQSKLFPATGGNAQGSYKPTSTMTSSHVSYTQSLPATYKQKAVGFEPRSVKMPTSQRFNYKPSYTSTEQMPSRTSSMLGSNRNPAQGAHNLPASGSSRAGTSPQHFAPTRTHNIPQRYGGFAIRRLKEPVDQKEVGVQRPQSSTVPPKTGFEKPQAPRQTPSYQPQAPRQTPSYQPQAPRQTPSYQPQAPSVHQPSKWKRVKLNWGQNQVLQTQ